MENCEKKIEKWKILKKKLEELEKMENFGKK